LLLLFFNWDKPFIIWQFIEPYFNSNLTFKAFFNEHKETFEYWKYYAEIDTITQNEKGETIATIKYNTTPIIAFFDGLLGAALLIGLILTGLILCVLILGSALLISNLLFNIFFFSIPLVLIIIEFRFSEQFKKHKLIIIGSIVLLILIHVFWFFFHNQVRTFIGISLYRQLNGINLIIGLSLNVFHAYIFRKKGLSEWAKNYFWLFKSLD
jgi:hypothetical protein